MRALTAAALAVALLGAGCACDRAGRAFRADAPGEEWVRTELVFGLGLAGDRTVAPAEWREFLDAEITPRFPAGLTILDASGQWRDNGGRVTAEPAKILLLLHPPDPALHAKIEEIRGLWKRRFGQESVMRVTTPAKTSF